MSIPGSVVTIGDWAFDLCRNLAFVTLGEGVETIGTAAFHECVNLRRINYPSTLKTIGGFAFQYDSSLYTPLALPEGFTSLGVVSYGDYVSLTSATFPGTMDSIPMESFWSCSSLVTVTFGEGITSIGVAAFAYCSSLQHVTIPSSMDSIGNYAFYDGVPDTLVMHCAVPPALGDTVFNDYHSLLIVPCGAAESYRQHEVWGLFSNIVEACTDIEKPGSADAIVRITVRDGRIIVDGTAGETVHIYDITGREVANKSLPFGIYLVKIGDFQTHKVVVVGD